MPIKHSFTAVANTSTLKAADWNADHTIVTSIIFDSDVALYRGGANTLKTDSKFNAFGLGVSGVEVITSAGVLTNLTGLANVGGVITDTQHGSRGSALHTDSHARSHDHSLVADGSPIAVTGVPNLDVAKITTGRFGMARIPDGISNYVLTAQGAGVDPVYAIVSAGGAGSLSQLTIDITKDWQGYGITNFGVLTFGSDVNLLRAGVDILGTDDWITFNYGKGIGIAFETIDSWYRPDYGMIFAHSATYGEVNFLSHSWGYAPLFSWRDSWNNSLEMALISTGQLQLPRVGSGAGLLIGGDVNLYRSGANVLATDDNFNCVNLTTGVITATAANELVTGANNNQVIIRRDANYIYICPWGTDTAVNKVLFGGGAGCNVGVDYGTLSCSKLETASNALVSNLNADLLDGYHASEVAAGLTTAGTIFQDTGSPYLNYAPGNYDIATITVNFGYMKSCLITGGYSYLEGAVYGRNWVYIMIDGVSQAGALRGITSEAGKYGYLESAWVTALTGAHTLKLRMSLANGSVELEYYNFNMLAT